MPAKVQGAPREQSAYNGEVLWRAIVIDADDRGAEKPEADQGQEIGEGILALVAELRSLSDSGE